MGMKPLPKCGPCTINGQDAPFCVIGLDPGRGGGGVLHWAWSIEEAGWAADSYREHGYHEVKVRDALAERTRDEVHKIIFGLLLERELFPGNNPNPSVEET
jgi:hypothetical protein